MVLSLLLLQVEANLTNATRNSQKNDTQNIVKFAFHDHCDEIYKAKNLAAYIIEAVMDKLMVRLKTACGIEEMFPLVPNIVAGNLWCNGNFPTTADILLNYIYYDADRDCQQIPGFFGVYIKLED